MAEGDGELQRVSEDFVKELKDIQKARAEAGVHKRHNSIRYLTELITRHNSFDRLKEKMINWREVVQ